MQSEHLLFFSILRKHILMRNLTEVIMTFLVGWTDHSFTPISCGGFYRTPVLAHQKVKEAEFFWTISSFYITMKFKFPQLAAK